MTSSNAILKQWIGIPASATLSALAYVSFEKDEEASPHSSKIQDCGDGGDQIKCRGDEIQDRGDQIQDGGDQIQDGRYQIKCRGDEIQDQRDLTQDGGDQIKCRGDLIQDGRDHRRNKGDPIMRNGDHRELVSLSAEDKTLGLLLDAPQMRATNFNWTFESVRATHGVGG